MHSLAVRTWAISARLRSFSNSMPTFAADGVVLSLSAFGAYQTADSGDNPGGFYAADNHRWQRFLAFAHAAGRSFRQNKRCIGVDRHQPSDVLGHLIDGFDSRYRPAVWNGYSWLKDVRLFSLHKIGICDLHLKTYFDWLSIRKVMYGLFLQVS
jgi:hypothetical protein